MKKRILHYLLLAVILLGAPALFAWLGGKTEIWEGVTNFPPRTEDWGFHPEKLWNYKCPFSWYWWFGFFAFTVVTMGALVRRALKGAFAPTLPPPPRTPARFPWWGYLGLSLIGVFWFLSWHRFPCLKAIQIHLSYFPIWMGYILVMNALCVKRSGKSPLTSYPKAFLITFPVSALFWWFFEYLNRYVWNWYYLGVSHVSAMEYLVYGTLCFSSVLPAVCATAAWLHTFPAFQDGNYDHMAHVDLTQKKWTLFLIVLAAIGLAGIVFVPQYVFPLVWLSPLAVFLLVQNLLQERGTFQRMKAGNWSLFMRFSLAALICGFFWETWNWLAAAKWVYAVAYVHRFQIWEMPLIGFAGYLPFGWECAAVTAWILPALVEDESPETSAK